MVEHGEFVMGCVAGVQHGADGCGRPCARRLRQVSCERPRLTIAVSTHVRASGGWSREVEEVVGAGRITVLDIGGG